MLRMLILMGFQKIKILVNLIKNYGYIAKIQKNWFRIRNRRDGYNYSKSYVFRKIKNKCRRVFEVLLGD